MDAEDFKLLRKAADQGVLNSLHGNRFSLTGKLSMKRQDFIHLINACKGTWDEVPNYGTNYLIVGDTGRFGRTEKIRAAEQRGTLVITEADFVKMIMPS